MKIHQDPALQREIAHQEFLEEIQETELTKHFSSDEVTKKLERMRKEYGDE